MNKDLKIIEGEIVPIYENNKGDRLINARELHEKLRIGRDFTTWMKNRINKYKFKNNEDYILTFPKIGERKNVVKHEYFLTLDTAKELCMIENNKNGRIIRKYFIEVEKRYRSIVENPRNIFDIMHQALNQIEENENKIKVIERKTNKNENEIEEIKKKIDVVIKKYYCLASDIAEELELYSENDLPHSNLIGANPYYQVYYKPKAIKEIITWFNRNKKEIEYRIIYERNTKNGKKGEVKEHGYKIEKICYKVIDN